MSKILALDPGKDRTGWVEMIDEKPVEWGWDTNVDMRSKIEGTPFMAYDAVAVEYMRPRGMPTSGDEMDTMYELGRMTASYEVDRIAKVARKDVKMFLLGRASGNDANIRQALIDLFGGNRHAIGAIKCDRCKGKGWNGVGRLACVICHHLVDVEPKDRVGSGLVSTTKGCGWEVPPGVLHRLTGHAWSALGVGVTYIAAANAESSEVAL